MKWILIFSVTQRAPMDRIYMAVPPKLWCLLLGAGYYLPIYNVLVLEVGRICVGSSASIEQESWIKDLDPTR